MSLSLQTASSSGNPATSFSTLWAHVRSALDHIMHSFNENNEKPPSIDYTLYTTIHSSLYNYFTNRCNEVGAVDAKGALPGSEVYCNLEKFFQETCQEILLNCPEDGAELVTFVVSTFRSYSARASAVDRLLSYVNRHYVKRAIEEDKGWVNINDALAMFLVPREGDQQQQRPIALIKYDAKMVEMKKWGYKDGDPKSVAAVAEACGEAASSLDRVVSVLSMARRRFRTEVFEPLMASPIIKSSAKPKSRIKAPKGPAPYRPKGRLARAVQAYRESAPPSERDFTLSALDDALRTTGIRQETHLRKRLQQLLSASGN